MYVQRYYLECLSHASYLIADEVSKEAVVIDPQRDIEIYVEDAQQHGFEIKHVILTHFHADFVAGHIEIRDRFGAAIYLGQHAEADFEFEPLSDGSVIDLSTGRLEALETPGHTPEGISLLLFDDEHDADEPRIIFTGDTLFVGDVGRPDLMASIGFTAQELAESLYDSLHSKIMQLPDETIVYPAHGAGSMCGKNLGDEAFSTIGEQRQYNYALQPMERDEFVEMVTMNLPQAPAYFGHDAMLNRQERSSLEKSMQRALRKLDREQFLELRDNGAQVLDVRSLIDFAGRHLAGAINVDIDGRFASWAGTILDPEQAIIVVADDDRVDEAIMRLGRIGFDNVQGYLEHGMESFHDTPQLLSSIQRISAPALCELDGSSGDIHILDVRNLPEREAGYLEGSQHIPLGELRERLAEVPDSGTLVVHCQGGYRSSIAASLLQRDGRDNVIDLVGGFQAWSVSKLPIATPSKSN